MSLAALQETRCKTDNHTPESRLELPNKGPKLNVKDLNAGLTGTRPVVVGWGYTNPDQRDQEDNFNVGAPKATQQMLAVPILSSSQCGKLLLTPEKSQICAGGDRGKDACRVRQKSF